MMEMFEEDEEVSFSGLSFSKRSVNVSGKDGSSTVARAAFSDISNTPPQSPARTAPVKMSATSPGAGNAAKKADVHASKAAASVEDTDTEEEATAKDDQGKEEETEEEEEEAEEITPTTNDLAPSNTNNSNNNNNNNKQHSREVLIQKNQDVISIYKRGRRSMGSLEGVEESEVARVQRLEKELLTTREALFKAEERVDALNTTVLHWQEVASQHAPSVEQTGRGMRALDKARMQQEKLERVVERLVRYVDAETILEEAGVAVEQEESIRMRAIRKSLETMTPLFEDGEEHVAAGRGAVEVAIKELAMVARMKQEAVDREEVIDVLHNRLADASDREKAALVKLQQSREENEELNKLTGEMQSAHARLMVMFQNLADSKKLQGGTAGSLELAARIEVLEQTQATLETEKGNAEEACAQAEARKGELEERVDGLTADIEFASEEIERLEKELERGSSQDVVEGLSSELRRTREEAGKLEGRLEKVMGRVVELEGGVREGEERQEEMEGMLEANEELIAELKGALVDAEEKLREAEERHRAGEGERTARHQGEVDMWMERVATLEKIMDQSGARVEELKEGLAGSQVHAAELQAALAVAEGRAVALVADKAAAESEEGQREDGRRRLAEEGLREAKTRLEAAEGELAERDAEVGLIKRALAERDAEYRNAKVAVAERDAQLKDVESALAERDAETLSAAPGAGKVAVAVGAGRRGLGSATMAVLVAVILAIMLMVAVGHESASGRMPLVF